MTHKEKLETADTISKLFGRIKELEAALDEIIATNNSHDVFICYKEALDIARKARRKEDDGPIPEDYYIK